MVDGDVFRMSEAADAVESAAAKLPIVQRKNFGKLNNLYLGETL